MKLAEIIAAAQTAENPNYEDLIAQIRGSDEFQDLQAERDSLREENELLLQSAADTQKELEETKKLNFTLGRQISRAPVKSVEELINDMF